METGITAATPNRLILDAGALYRNYGEPSQALIGATRGGATFTVEKEDRMPELDGIRGPVKGLRRPIRLAARLEATVMEPSLETLQDLARGDASSDGTHFTIIPDRDIVLTDYWINVALVADIANTATPIVIKVLNALATGEWTLGTDDQNEGEIGVTWEGHYDAADLTGTGQPPYEIMLPVAAS